MIQAPVVAAAHRHPASQQEPAEPPPTDHAQDKLPWIFRSKKRKGLGCKSLLLGALGPVAIIFALAITLGLSINHVYTGSAVSGGNEAIFGPKWRASNPEIAASMEGSAAMVDIRLDAFGCALASAAVATAMALVRFFLRFYTHSRVYGMFSFISYFTLLSILLWQMFSGDELTVITNPASRGFATQIYALLGDNFNVGDAPFATTFSDIASHADFWNWMKGPFRNFLLSTKTNVKLEADHLPQVAPQGASKQPLPMWVLNSCNLRTVDTVIEERRVLNYFASVTEYTFPDFSKATERTVIPEAWQHYWAESNFSFVHQPATFRNIYGQTRESWDYVGASGVRYPGTGGSIATNRNWWLGDGRMFDGTWFVENVQNGSAFAASYDSEIEAFIDRGMLTQSTALIQVTCLVTEASQDLQAVVAYTVEFANSGKVTPNVPTVTIAKFPIASHPLVYYPLVLAFYILSEELQDLIVGGPAAYFLHSGLLNLMDQVAWITMLLVWIFEMIYFGVVPRLDEAPDRFGGDLWWSLAAVQATWQVLVGIAAFAYVLKGLKFTRNIPVMAHIGNTFSHTLLDVSLFLCVVGVMLLAFGIVFHFIFVITPMDSFGSLTESTFSLFRGLLGDMDVDGLKLYSPTWGPLLYVVYVTVVLFVAFTVLIAIVCESFGAIMDETPSDGVIVNTINWFKSLSTSDTEPHEDQEDFEECEALEKTEPKSKKGGQEQEEMKQVMQKLDRLERMIQGLQAHLGVAADSEEDAVTATTPHQFESNILASKRDSPADQREGPHGDIGVVVELQSAPDKVLKIGEPYNPDAKACAKEKLEVLRVQRQAGEIDESAYRIAKNALKANHALRHVSVQ